MIVQRPQTNFTIYRNNLLVPLAPLDWAVQVYLPAVYGHVVSPLCSKSTLPDPPGRNMYVWHDSYPILLDSMSRDIYKTFRNGEPYADSQQWRKQQRKIRLFFVTEPLETVVVGVWSTPLERESSNQYIFVVTDRFLKHITTIKTIKTTATTVTTIFMEAWVSMFGTPRNVQVGSSPRITSNFHYLYTCKLRQKRWRPLNTIPKSIVK